MTFVYTTSYLKRNASRPVYSGIDLCPDSPTVVGPCSPYAPVFERVYTSIARILPLLSAPMRTRIFISCLGDEAVCDSFLVNIIIDGLPVIRVTKAGNTSATTVCFAPNPPPIRGLNTWILFFGIPSAFERIRRTWKTIWVELKTFSLPYASM